MLKLKSQGAGTAARQTEFNRYHSLSISVLTNETPLSVEGNLQTCFWVRQDFEVLEKVPPATDTLSKAINKLQRAVGFDTINCIVLDVVYIPKEAP